MEVLTGKIDADKQSDEWPPPRLGLADGGSSPATVRVQKPGRQRIVRGCPVGPGPAPSSSDEVRFDVKRLRWGIPIG